MNLPKKIKLAQIEVSTWWQDMLIHASLNLKKPLNKPTSIIFNLTPNCVLKCRQCDIWKNPPEKHLTFNEAKIIIDRLHSWLGNCYIFFTGGEPLMNKDLPKIIGYAYSLGIISHINSNATLLDKPMAKKLVENHLYAISISIDGATAKTHDYLRGVPGTYGKAIKAIKYLQETPSKPYIYINTVMMKQNVAELEKLIKIAKKNETNGISFQCLLPNLGPNSSTHMSKNNPLWPQKSKITAVLKKIIKTTKSEPIIITSHSDLKTAIRYYQNPNMFSRQPCAAGVNNFIIDHQGNIRLCFGFPIIGNILKDTPQTIWWSKTAQTQRDHIRNCRQSCKIIVCNKADTRRNKTAALNLFE
ncbi:MAG TPA: radical SAM protein [Candidatus Methanoperedens sp.]|nr:radical SAM protein [Candidatus Methanoperedens sp.]